MGKERTTGPVWEDRHGKPLRCERCGKPRMRGTALCVECNKTFWTNDEKKRRA